MVGVKLSRNLKVDLIRIDPPQIILFVDSRLNMNRGYASNTHGGPKALVLARSSLPHVVIFTVSALEGGRVAIRLQIICINKSNRKDPHDRILNVGGVVDGLSWKIPESQAITSLENHRYSYFVNRGGREVAVIVGTRNGVRYLKTIADGETPDNLLSLPECP